MDSTCQGSIEDDDFFGDDETHQDKLNTNSVLDLDREWQARYKQFHTVGYREGLFAGKETAAQLGFNNGFKESVLIGYNFGKVRGITSLFAILPEHVKVKLVETSEGRTKLEALHGKVSSMSGKDALKLFHEDVLKDGVEAKMGRSKDNSQVDLEGNLQTLKLEEHIGSSSNTSCTDMKALCGMILLKGKVYIQLLGNFAVQSLFHNAVHEIMEATEEYSIEVCARLSFEKGSIGCLSSTDDS